MPVTSVKAPDGSIIKVNHPEGAPREVILEYALQQYQARSAEPGTAPEIPTIGGAELEGATGPSRSLIPDLPENYSVGDALVGLRNMGVPNEAIAAVETLLTLGTGAVGGTAGMLAGTIGAGIGAIERGEFGTPQAAQAIQEAAMRGAESLTYSPRTEMAQRMLGQVAEASEPLAQLPPVLPTAGLPGAAAATLPQRARMAQAAIPERRAAAPEVPVAPEAPMVDEARLRVTGQRPATPPRIVTGEAEPMAPSVAGEALDVVEEAPTLQAGPRSVGAAEVPAETIRRERALSLPVPFEGGAALTKGKATRNFGQLQFERETAKLAGVGEPILERLDNQGGVGLANFDAFIDVLDPIATTAREAGAEAVQALVSSANKQKREIQKLYKEAREVGAMAEEVEMQPLADVLMELRSYERVAPSIAIARDEARRLGFLEPKTIEGSNDPGPFLQGGTGSINDIETLRQGINRATDWNDPRDALFARRVIRAIDNITEGKGGEVYRKARKKRAEYADRFENIGLVSRLIETKKGTTERKVALQDVFDKVMRFSDLEEMNKVRAQLLRSGEPGKQAWAELKAQVLKYIRDSSLSTTPNQQGVRPILPGRLAKAVQKFDAQGKLESLYGKRQAQMIRDLAEVMADVGTAPAGAINNSNTSSALQNAMQMIAENRLSAVAPVTRMAIQQALTVVKDQKLKARVRDALKEPNE